MIERAGSSKQGALWKCRCDCGNTIIAHGTGLRGGYYKSCGCLHLEKIRENAKNRVEDLTALNGRLYSSNKTGVRGVFKRSSDGKYVASIKFKGEFKYLGAYSNLEDATRVRKEAEEKIFKPFVDEHKA